MFRENKPCPSTFYPIIFAPLNHIVLLVDNVYTLVDVVIVNPIRIDLVLEVVFSHGVVTIVVVEVKDDFYCNRFPMDMFVLLVVEVFGCLH